MALDLMSNQGFVGECEQLLRQLHAIVGPRHVLVRTTAMVPNLDAAVGTGTTRLKPFHRCRDCRGPEHLQPLTNARIL